MPCQACFPAKSSSQFHPLYIEIDRADELGSGMLKMMMYGKKYGGLDPQLIEGDIFRMIISVPEFGANTERALEPSQVGVHDGVHDGVVVGN